MFFNSRSLILVITIVFCATVVCGQSSRKKSRSTKPHAEKSGEPSTSDQQSSGRQIVLADGRTLIVDEVWKQAGVVWYKRGGVTQSLEGQVTIKPTPSKPTQNSSPISTAKSNEQTKPAPSMWIHLVGGARFKVDEVRQTSAGTWYDRGGLTAFLEQTRIARIERRSDSAIGPGSRNRDWTSGSSQIDDLIRANGERFGIDPYLIFCVIEQESHFRTRAVSPKGARGLMQLMPATARRLGVRHVFDPAANIRGGTQYLRELMDMFGGRVNLVLASYNAGEGAVMKYGRNVPPYRETREYVKRIGKRYGLDAQQRTDEQATDPR